MPDSETTKEYNTEAKRQALAMMSSTKRTHDDTELLVNLNLEKDEEAKTKIFNLLKRKQAPDDTFDYIEREKLAAQCAAVHVADDAHISPTYVDTMYRTLSSVTIQVAALAREALLRSDLMTDVLKNLEAIWAGNTAQDVAWRVEGAAAEVLFDLKEAVSRAKRHSDFVDNCMRTVSNTKFIFDKLVENMDRMNSYKT